MTEGTVLVETEITPINSAHCVYSWFYLNEVQIGEFDGVLLNCVAVVNWGHLLNESFQCDPFLKFLQRRTDEDSNNLSHLRVLVLLNMKLKEEFRGKGLGGRILKQLIIQPPPDYLWDVALGWSRSYDGRTDKNLNKAATRIFAHYEKNLPNCVRWNDKSTFFLSVSGEFQAENATDLLRKLVQRKMGEKLVSL
jgi:hypothetical protein